MYDGLCFIVNKDVDLFWQLCGGGDCFDQWCVIIGVVFGNQIGVFVVIDLVYFDGIWCGQVDFVVWVGNFDECFIDCVGG